MSSTLSLSNPVFASFAGYSTVCLCKMMMMSPLTARLRMKLGVFSNSEDVPLHEEGRVDFTNQDLERVRRNHQNDIENIPLFVMLGGFYVMTGPDETVAVWHFRVFTAARILHTLAYQAKLPQPARFLAFLVGAGTTTSIAVQIFRSLKGLNWI